MNHSGVLEGVQTIQTNKVDENLVGVHKGVQHVDTPILICIWLDYSMKYIVARAEQGQWLHTAQAWVVFIYIIGNGKGCQKLCTKLKLYTFNALSSFST